LIKLCTARTRRREPSQHAPPGGGVFDTAAIIPWNPGSGVKRGAGQRGRIRLFKWSEGLFAC